MKIVAIDAQVGSKIINNDGIIEMIRDCSKDQFQGNLERFLTFFKRVLVQAGSNERRVLDKNETPLQLVEMAVNNVLNKANWQKKDIELIIYVGIGRAVIEPGNSYILAQALGFKRADCFDIIDACMSWTRALDVANQYFKTKRYKKIMILNAEFNALLDHGGGLGYPSNFTYTNKEEMNWKFPTATIGEAASATLLSNEGGDENFEFHFASYPEYADLCSIVTKGYEVFIQDSQKQRLGKCGVNTFTSYGFELHKHTQESDDVFNQLTSPKKSFNIVFTHASSSTVWAKACERVGVSDMMYHIFPKTGNLVSASIPTAMYMAEQEHKLKRGDRVAVWVGSAGMSFAAVSFIY